MDSSMLNKALFFFCMVILLFLVKFAFLHECELMQSFEGVICIIYLIPILTMFDCVIEMDA